MWNEPDLINVCKKYTESAPTRVVVKEPYIPYKPENWNGILILAEAQTPDKKYFTWLRDKLSSEQRMKRLGPNWPEHPYSEQIGVGPWDNGTLKLAMQALFLSAKLDLKLDDIALSNAVPWTCESKDSKNLNPTEQMQAIASQFWKEIFGVWQPDVKALVVLGNVAQRVMVKAGILSDEKYKDRWVKLRLPSRNAIDRVSGMFDPHDLEVRFPKVKEAREAQGISTNDKAYKRKIFFACHAVSLGGPKLKEWFAEIRSPGN